MKRRPVKPKHPFKIKLKRKNPKRRKSRRKRSHRSGKSVTRAFL